MAMNGFTPSNRVEHSVKRTAYRSPESLTESGLFNNRCEGIGEEFAKCQDHSRLVVISGVKAVEDLDGLSVSDIATLRQRAHKYQSGIRLIDERCENIEHELDSVKRNIHQFVQDLIVSLHRRKEELMTKAEDGCMKSLEQLKIQKEELLAGLKELERALLQRENSTRKNGDTEWVEQGGQERADEEVYLYPAENVHFNFRPRCEAFDVVEIGNVVIAQSCAENSTAEGEGLFEAFSGLRAQFSVMTRNERGEQVYCPGDHITVKLRSQEDKTHYVKTLVEDEGDGSYSVSYLAEREGLYEVSLVLNGVPIPIPPEPIAVEPRLFSPTFSIGQQGTNQGEFRKPWGVAVSEEDQIAVADLGNNRIQVLTSEGKVIRCFGRNGGAPGEFNGPCDIAWGRGGNILVSDSGNHRIQVFTKTGKFIKTFGKEGNLNGDLCFPHGVSTDCHGNVIVVDTGNKRIQIFSPDGKFKFAIDRGLYCPMSCVFIDDHFVVSDVHDHRVKVFNARGQFMHGFGTKGNKLGTFNCPVGLAADKAGHILVCDRGNCRVQLFNLDGSFQSKFGSSGQGGLGCFASPCSVAVLTDGRFAVSDLETSSLQFFE